MTPEVGALWEIASAIRQMAAAVESLGTVACIIFFLNQVIKALDKYYDRKKG